MCIVFLTAKKLPQSAGSARRLPKRENQLLPRGAQTNHFPPNLLGNNTTKKSARILCKCVWFFGVLRRCATCSNVLADISLCICASGSPWIENSSHRRSRRTSTRIPKKYTYTPKTSPNRTHPKNTWHNTPRFHQTSRFIRLNSTFAPILFFCVGFFKPKDHSLSKKKYTLLPSTQVSPVIFFVSSSYSVFSLRTPWNQPNPPSASAKWETRNYIYISYIKPKRLK